MKWWVYLVECNDGTYYCGITTDVQRRIRTHNLGKGAKYTRGRLPVVLLHAIQCPDRSSATRLEIATKKMPKRKKIDFLRKNGEGLRGLGIT
jgi:putative endonuclease